MYFPEEQLGICDDRTDCQHKEVNPKGNGTERNFFLPMLDLSDVFYSAFNAFKTAFQSPWKGNVPAYLLKTVSGCLRD